jgi:hypothetical protein
MEKLEIIEKLEQEKNELEIKIEKINEIISNLKSYYGLVKVVNVVKNAKIAKVTARPRYTKEMFEFVKENMNGLSNKELAKLVNETFNVKMKDSTIAVYLSDNKLKRSNTNFLFKEKPKKDLFINGEKVPEKIMELVKKRKNIDPLTLRDEIIELYEKNFKITEIEMMQSQFKEKRKIIKDDF